MKILLYFFAVLLLGYFPSKAQFTISGGPYIYGKYGINISERPYYSYSSYYNRLTVTTENDPSMDVDFGIVGKISLVDIGMTAIFDGGYSTTSSTIKLGSDATDNETYTTRVHYLNLSPMLNFKWFLIGGNFGLPLSATTTNASDTRSISAASSEEMRMKIELRLGATFPVVKNSNGNLNLVVLGNFMFTGLYGDTPYDNPGYAILHYSNLTNPRVWTLSLGVNYLFNIIDQP
ncbi:MAG: hypothetical protein U0264_19215 [Candidatus Kapaibacterium sp.]